MVVSGHPPEIIERHFVRRDGRWEILPHLKGMVTFAYHNLAADPYPALANQTNAMDLILCRNVLMYFAAVQARKVLQNQGKSLVEGGWLIVSLTETSMVRLAPLVTVNFPGATVCRKDSDASQNKGIPRGMNFCQPAKIIDTYTTGLTIPECSNMGILCIIYIVT